MHVLMIVVVVYLVLSTLLVVCTMLFKQHVDAKVRVMNSFYLWEKEMKQD